MLHRCLQCGFNPNATDLSGCSVMDEAEYWCMRAASATEREHCLQCRYLLAAYGARRGHSEGVRKQLAKLERLAGQDGDSPGG